MSATPNIVLILTDDLGYGDLSCYGQKTWATPGLDRMAAEGVRFTDFYTTSPVCSPARTSLLTGLHSGHVCIRQLRDAFLPDAAATLPRQLAPAGYTAACIGKYGVGDGQPHVDALRKGFDYHYGYNCMRHAHNYFPPFLRENGLKVMLRNKPPAGDERQLRTGVGVAAEKVDYSPDFIETKALEFIEAHRDGPFFLYYCPTLPHANNEGWTDERQTADGMEVDTYGEFAGRDWSPNEKGFARMIQRIDVTVGRLLAKLDELGIADNTLVLFSSDNGPHNEGGHSVTRFDSAGGFQGYKRSLHEGGIRVPFIVRWPGRIPPGRTSGLPAYFPDLMSTLCDYAGVPAPESTDGLSLTETLTGDETAQRRHDHLYFEYRGQLAVRRGRMKYYRDAEGNESLYDIEADRHEDRDIKSEHPDVFGELKDIAAAEHLDYTPFEVPGGQVYE